MYHRVVDKSAAGERRAACQSSETAPEEPAASFKSASLYEQDIALLTRPAWINDSVLGFWCEVVETACDDAASSAMSALASAAGASAALKPRVVCMQPAVAMMLLHETDAEDLAGLAGPRGLALNTATALFAPVSDAEDVGRPEQGSHWTLLAWARGRGFAHFDSMSRGETPSVARLAAVLAPMLGGAGELAAVTAVRCPVQRNGVDCGVHVAWAMDALALHAVREDSAGGSDWEAALVAPVAASVDVAATMLAYRAHMLAVANAHRHAGARAT